MEYCDCNSPDCRVCFKSLRTVNPMANSLIDMDAVKEDFEAFCRQPPNFYNLTPSTEDGKTYWALSTERAFAIWKAAVLKMMKNLS